MKKLLLIFVIIALTLSAYSCGNNDTGDVGNNDSSTNQGGDQGGDKPEGGDQGGDSPEGGDQGGDKPEGGDQGGDKPEGGDQGGDKPEGGDQGGDSPEGGDQGGDKPEGGDQGGDKPEGGDQGGDSPEGGSSVIAPGETVYIVAGELSDDEGTVRLAEALNSLLYRDGAGGAVICESGEDVQGHVLTVGNIDSLTLSEYGKSLFDSVSKSSPYEAAYAIYSDGDDITVVFENCKYSLRSSYDSVVDRVISLLCASKDGMSLESAREIGKVDLYAMQLEIDRALVAEEWARIERELGAEVAEALKLLYTLYPDSIADWSASMYSGGYIDFERKIWVGGYYESTSGRMTDGFGPDVEATAQTLNFIQQSGMIDSLGKDLTLAIPKDMQRELVYFAKSLQNENGYFYHPQWSFDETNQKLGRRGRDLGWAVSILRTFGAKPTYNTPSGEVGDGLSADEYLSGLGASYVLFLTEGLGTSTASAVSKVIALGDDNTSFLADFEEFIDYLHSKDVDANPYSSTFNATYKQIAAASKKMGKYTPSSEVTDEKYLEYSGLTMCEILIKYLNDRINPKTGLWGKDWEEYNAKLDAEGDTETKRMTGTEFKYTNGLHSHIPIYNSWKIPYPYIEEATRSVLEGLMSDEKSTGNICELYNQWFCLVELKENAKKYHGESGEEILSFISDSLEEYGALAITNTYTKLKGYKKADGGFAHNVYEGTKKNQGMPTGLGLDESNVDAVCIGVTGMVRTVFDALGSTRVPIFTESDFMRYLYILDTNPAARKGVVGAAVRDFESGEPYDIRCDGEMTVEDGELHISAESEYIIIPKSDVRNIGSILLFECVARFACDGDYTLSFIDSEGDVCELTLSLCDGTLSVLGCEGCASITYGETVKISIELSSHPDGTMANVSVNGTSFALSTDLIGGRVSFSPSQITELRISKPISKLILDKVLLVQTDSKVHRFDKMPDSLYIKYVNGSSVPENTLTVTERDEKSILLYHRETTFNGSQSYADIMATYTSPTAERVRFETDMKITGVTYKEYIEFALMPYGAGKGERTYKGTFTLENTAEGSPIFYRDSSIDGGYTKSRDTGIKVGEWFNLAIEYTKENDGKFVTRVYLNGTLFHETELIYGTAQEPSMLNCVRFAPFTAFAGEIYFDNMSLVQD